MRLLGLLNSYLSRICAHVGGLTYEIATFLNNILPALLSADELTRLIRVHYEGMYGHAAAQYSAEVLEWGLESWEEEVVVQHKIVSGATMVLGAGVGEHGTSANTPVHEGGLYPGSCLALTMITAASARDTGSDGQYSAGVLWQALTMPDLIAFPA